MELWKKIRKIKTMTLGALEKIMKKKTLARKKKTTTMEFLKKTR
jgi:hypothetical protein